MAEEFQLTVHYKNEDRDFNAELRPMGYSYKIAVFIDGNPILFEPDEERNYRAVFPEGIVPDKPPPLDLVQAIAIALEEAFK
jgi:hypothetical protein